jgi:16S rRNA (uracil1498-N3)-methyltransferase
MRRFFSPQPLSGTRCLLTGEEAHHLLHVSRIRPGESVILFDGRGGEYSASLVSASSGAAELELGPHNPDDRLPATTLVLASAIPKPAHMDALVQMTCELGVTTLIPMLTHRSVVQGGPGKIDHWRRIVVESCKQSGRNRLMTIEPPTPFDQVLRSPRGPRLSFLLDPQPSAPLLVDQLRAAPARTVLILVGPEGGFTDDELSAARQAGLVSVRLGPSILRIETAAVAASSLVLLVGG